MQKPPLTLLLSYVTTNRKQMLYLNIIMQHPKYLPYSSFAYISWSNDGRCLKLYMLFGPNEWSVFVHKGCNSIPDNSPPLDSALFLYLC